MIAFGYHESAPYIIYYYRGPDMPCFLNMLKWDTIMTSDMTGSKKVWMLYNRDNLPDLILNPPLRIRTNTNPIPGTNMSSASGTSVTIFIAQ